MYTEDTLLKKCMSVLKYLLICCIACVLSVVVSLRVIQLQYLNPITQQLKHYQTQINVLEGEIENLGGTENHSFLDGKKIVYDGDSIAEGRDNNGGSYPQIISEITGSTYVNFAKGGAYLCANEERHSVVNNLANLPSDGDLYCFEGGINDFWGEVPLGVCDPEDYAGPVDPGTLCGAMETIFRYCLEHLEGKPVCFVITHKTGSRANDNGDTFLDYHDAMIAVCEKYSIPYYDAYMDSGLNGWNDTQNQRFLNANEKGEGDRTHPNEDGYRQYYVPKLLDLFEKMLPAE